MSDTLALDQRGRLRQISIDVMDDVFHPPPQMTVSEWADENRKLPRTAAEPGRWRTDRIPYLRRIMDVLGDETIREVVFCKSAQVGGTSCGENMLGYLVDQSPCGILMLWPTEKKMKSWSVKNLKPMLEDTDCLKEKVRTSARRESNNTLFAKTFSGGFLQLLTAKSTSDLRSTSARVGIVEEVDEIDAEIGEQGDPMEQFDARFRTFWNAKVYKVSTPTLEGFSRIWDELLHSTYERYFVPCPDCGHMQVLRWRDGKDDQDESGAYHLVWELDEAGEVVPGSAKYVCEGCGCLIDEHRKMDMLLAGEWRATNPGRFAVGFHINTLYSPLTTWDDIARAFRRAHRDPTTMQAFVNLWLGLPYRPPGAAIDAHFLSARAEDYGEGIEVPHGVGVITFGADVQGDRIEVFRWGWGPGEESWLLDWEIVEGDPGEDETWQRVDRLLLTPMRHASGALVPIAAGCIDAGYQTEHVHRFCDARKSRNIVAVVGRSKRPRKLLETPDPQKFKRSKSQKRPTYVVGTDPAKDLLASRLRLVRTEAGFPPGYVHFPANIDPTFYDQLTAERLVTKYVAGRPTRTWTLIQGRRNEALDGTIYALAALHLLVQKRVIGWPDLKILAAHFSKAPATVQNPGQRRQRGMRSTGVV